MNSEYGKAVVEERANPQKYAELSQYLRMEYGPGTGPSSFLKEVAQDAGSSKGNGVGARFLRTLARAMRALAAIGSTKA